MSWSKKMSVLVSAALGIGSILLPGSNQIPESRAYADSNLQTELGIGDFESTDETWDFLIGSNGKLGNGEFRLDSGVHQSGNSSANLQLDFNQYYMVSLERYLFKRILPTDATELSFWVKTDDFTALDLVLMDSSNQNHQQTIKLQPTSDWQKITVTSFISGTNYVHWGGTNDGQWHGSLKKIHFKVSKPQVIPGKTSGSIWLDDIRAKVNTPDLAIAQTQVGNVFAGSRTGTFDVLTTGDQVVWTALDAWGREASSGSMPVQEGKARLNVQVPSNGYYRLKVDAYQAGEVIKTAETTFAALPEADFSQVADSPFAIQTHFGINWNREMMPLIKYAGVKTVRDSFYWSEIELKKDHYSFNPKFTLPMQALKENGIHPFLAFAFTNPFYDDFQTPYTDSAREGYVNYSKAVLNKFGSQLQAGEIWNEFNIPYFGSKGPAASRSDVYFDLLKKGYDGIKSVRPDLNVVGGATGGVPYDWLADVFQRGGLNYMDTLSVHPYRYPNSPEGLSAEIAKLNKLVRTYHNGDSLPIWLTEIGWPTHRKPQGVDEITQASYLIRSYVLSIASGVEKVFWYDLMNDGTDEFNNEDNFGIVHNVGDELGSYTPKPAYVALATLTRQLTGATFTGEQSSDGIYRYSFKKDSKSINVLWSLDQKEVALDTQSPVIVTDMMGRSETYVPDQGKIDLTLNGEPLFVQGDIVDTEERDTSASQETSPTASSSKPPSESPSTPPAAPSTPPTESPTTPPTESPTTPPPAAPSTPPPAAPTPPPPSAPSTPPPSAAPIPPASSSIPQSDENESIVSVGTLNDIPVPYGTEIDSVRLPSIVEVTVGSGGKAQSAVAWDDGAPLYEGNKAGTYTFTGTLTPPDGLSNPSGLKAKVNIVVGKPSSSVQDETDNTEKSGTAGQSGTELSDIQGHWAYKGIREAASAGWVNGYEDESFRPERSVSRAEFAVMLMRALDANGGNSGLGFRDKAKIPVWSHAAVATAVQQGLIRGFEDGTFRPRNSITRAEMIVMISRALQLPAAASDKEAFADEAKIPLWARGSAEAARQAGIASGLQGNQFVPGKLASRAEAAVLLLRMNNYDQAHTD